MLGRLEDRIRELCTKVVAVRGSEEFDQTITELKSALHEQAERMRKLAASAAMNERLPQDRRRSGPGTR